jgi:hypothetical protein
VLRRDLLLSCYDIDVYSLLIGIHALAAASSQWPSDRGTMISIEKDFLTDRNSDDDAHFRERYHVNLQLLGGSGLIPIALTHLIILLQIFLIHALKSTRSLRWPIH